MLASLEKISKDFSKLINIVLQSTIFEISKQPKIVNLYQDKTSKTENERF
jgi:hypothetical protein